MGDGVTEKRAEAPGAGSASRAGGRRGSATRALVMDTALRLFTERGYDRTTMRAIATEAGISVGNAYYYFTSKQELIQGFYHRISELHAEDSKEVLAAEREFGPRLRGVLLSWLRIAQPYHEFGPQLFKNAADPASPLSPFSPEAEAPRRAAIGILAEVVDGSRIKIDRELRADLPELLWLYQMGIVLFWVHDRSPDCSRTHRLVEHTVPLIERLVELSRLRPMRSLTRDAVRVLSEMIPPSSESRP
ncbi:TetR/AcrR family transcriptional regulator [Gandjariella thermophila]|uniref:TetR/AcrR family transcriptional regulator n=1 Tax=Gandjariella thermophila TaxID=1931992 RepID=UPI0027D9B042|nr:TetR family transcriptional regulator [Gandjariella thermophila]